MAFLQNNWLLILVMFASGAMLLFPLVQRRFGPSKDIGTLNVTHLINHQDIKIQIGNDTKPQP